MVNQTGLGEDCRDGDEFEMLGDERGVHTDGDVNVMWWPAILKCCAQPVCCERGADKRREKERAEVNEMR